MRNRPYYSRSNALCEKQAIKEEEKELDPYLWSSKTPTKWGSYSLQDDPVRTLQKCNGLKQMPYKESSIENIEWGQK